MQGERKKKEDFGVRISGRSNVSGFFFFSKNGLRRGAGGRGKRELRGAKIHREGIWGGRGNMEPGEREGEDGGRVEGQEGCRGERKGKGWGEDGAGEVRSCQMGGADRGQEHGSGDMAPGEDI